MSHQKKKDGKDYVFVIPCIPEAFCFALKSSIRLIIYIYTRLIFKTSFLLGSCLPSLTQTSSGSFHLHPPDSTTEGPPTICQIHSEIKIIIFTSSFSLSHYFAVSIVLLCFNSVQIFFCSNT